MPQKSSKILSYKTEQMSLLVSIKAEAFATFLEAALLKRDSNINVFL